MRKPRRTDDEVMRLLREGGPYEQVRKVISSFAGKLETAVNQRGGIGGIELRRLEFEAVDEVIETLGRNAGELWPASQGEAE